MSVQMPIFGGLRHGYKRMGDVVILGCTLIQELTALIYDLRIEDIRITKHRRLFAWQGM